MTPRRPLSDCSNIKIDVHDASCDEPWNEIPVWTGNPFAPESDATKTQSDRKEVRETAHEALKKMLGSTQKQSCPKDSTLLEYMPKPRPSPIYQDKQHEEYWTFLKSVPDVQTSALPPLTRCPSLMSGGTLSSRNSSTRSTRSSIWDPSEDRNNNVREICLIPECSGLCFKDVNAHTRMTHFTERLAEICPVKTCERHLRGFTRAGDRKRHVFTHFRGVLVCGFCETDSTCFSQASDRVDLFLTHLVKKHGVKPQQTDPQLDGGRVIRKNRNLSDGSSAATCSVCSEPFTAQVLYEHLPGCIFRVVARNEEFSGPGTHQVLSSASRGLDYQLKDEVHPTSPISEEEQTSSSQDAHEPELLQVSVESTELECKDIVELTASSRCLSLTSSKAVDSSGEDTDWTEEVTSRESSPGMSQLPRRLSPAKRRVVETIMQEFQRLFSQSLRTHATGGSSSGSSHGGYSGWSSNTSTYSSASFVSRKRSLSGGGSTPPNDDDDSNKRRRPDTKFDGKQPVSELRFACPYYKRNPGRHPTFTSCRDPGFVTVARLKEHLYRRHLLPPQCHRCCTTFTNDIALRDHQRDARGCSVQELPPLEGFDKDQERRLKSKKRSQQYQSEEDKWKGVYRILFPDDNDADMPSAYIEYQPCTSQTSESSSPITRFQAFSRLELPRLVRRTLESVVEQEAQPLEERLKERLVDIVQECQTQLVTMFHLASGPADIASTLPLPSEAQQRVISRDALQLFDGFDSLPARIGAATDLLGTPLMQRKNDFHGEKVGCTASGSPDSGYDSSWPAASTMAFLHPGIHITGHGDVRDMSILQQRQVPARLTTTNEYADLGGYYGLFGDSERDRQVDVNIDNGCNVGGDIDPSTWSFIDSLPTMSQGGSGNPAGVGRLSELSESGCAQEW